MCYHWYQKSVPQETVEVIAQSIAINNLSLDAELALAPDVEYRMREILQVIHVYKNSSFESHKSKGLWYFILWGLEIAACLSRILCILGIFIKLIRYVKEEYISIIHTYSINHRKKEFPY